MAKPVIVFAPGAWHVPEHFVHVRRELEASGYICVGVNLPCNNAEPYIDGRLVELDDDTAAIRKVVVGQLDQGSNVVLVLHSYSSIPGTASLSGLSAEARKSEGKSTSVLNVVIISGLLVPPGTTAVAAMGGQLLPQYLHEGDVTLPFNGPGAIEILYNDIDTLEVQKAIWRLKPQSYAVNTSATPDQGAALQGVPVSYLLCSNDNAVPFALQKQAVDGFRAVGCSVYAEVAPSGHSPFLKLPKETAKFIRRAAGEELNTGFEEFKGE